MNPVPTSLEHARFSTSFTSGGDERILRCTISHNLKDRTTTPLSFDPRKHTCSSCVAGAHECILSLIAMLNDAFGTNLCTTPLLYRKSSDWKAAATTKAKELLIAVVGGSNANRIAERLERDERQVFRLTTPGWRITRGGVESMVNTIASLDPQPDCLVIVPITVSKRTGLCPFQLGLL